MAHMIQPHPQAQEQLRTEAPSQKEHSDKYVSAFVSGDAAVDMSFRNPVLAKSADHFKVGIDELTVNLGNLSMLEYGVNQVMFRTQPHLPRRPQTSRQPYSSRSGYPPLLLMKHRCSEGWNATCNSASRF